MPAVSSGDANIIRSPYARLAGIYVNVPPLNVLATAEIAATPSSYPAADYAVTNTSANFEDAGVGIESQFVRIYKPSGKLAFEGILRRNNIADTHIRLPARNMGDTGIARQFYQVIEAGDSVVIYDARVPKSMLSFLDPDTGEHFKRFDHEFDAGGTYGKQTVYPKPVVNFGGHQHAIVNPSTGTATFTLDASASHSWNENAVTYAWELPAGVSIVTGTDTDAVITVEAVPGAHQIALRVEDSVTENQKRGYRYLYVTDGEDGEYPAFSEVYPLIAIENDVHERLGRRMSLRFKVSRDDNTFWQKLHVGAQVLVKTLHEYSDDVWQTRQRPTAGVIESYTGYIRSYDVEYDKRGVRTFVVHLESALQYASALPIAGQLIREATDPASWQEIPVDFNHIAFMVYYLIEYHMPSLFQLLDFDYGSMDGFRKFGFNVPRGNVTSAVQFIVNTRPGANIGVTSDGTIVMRPHPWVESSSYRSTVPVVWTWKAEDVKERYGFHLNPIKRTGLTWGSAFVWGAGNTTSVVKGWTGGFAMEQAASQNTMQDFIAASEADALAVVGNWHAMENAAVPELPLDILYPLDVFEPALMEIHKLELYDPMENDAEIFTTTQRAIVTSVRRTWSVVNGTPSKRLSVTFQPETSGAPATLVPQLERGEPLVDLPDAPPVGSECYLWASVGATPAGWSAAGVISDITSWIGGGGINGSVMNGTYNATRASGTRWNTTSPGPGTLIGIKRVYTSPITVTTLRFELDAAFGNSKTMLIGCKNSDGTYEALTYESWSGGGALTQIREKSWAGVREVTELYFLAHSGTSGTIVRIPETEINC